MELFTMLFRYILLYCIIMGGSIFIADKAKKKIEYCIAPNIAIIILILYAFGIFNVLLCGVWVVAILNIILGGYTIVKSGKELKEKVLTPGFFFFTILFFILLITTYQKDLTDYDHFTYRSLNTKIMYYTDCMNRGFGGLYPPASNILQYFFMKIIGIYLQGIEAFAMQLFGFSLMLPIFDRMKNTKFMNIIVTILILCIPAIFKNLVFYESAYPDALLGLLIGYSFYVLLTEKSNYFKLLLVALSLGVTTIVKPAGFYVAGIVIGMYLLVQWQTKENRKAFWKSNTFKTICIIVMSVFIVFASWKIFVKINAPYNQNIIREDQPRVGNKVEYILKNVMTTVLGYYEENHDSADSNENLIPKLYEITAITSPTKISLYGTMIMIILGAILSYQYLVKEENKKEYKSAMIALTLGMIAYVFLLQASYILKFITKEMLGHNGLDRYMPTFLLGMIYVIIAMNLKNMEEKREKNVNYVLLVAIIIAVTPLQSIANSTITSGIYNIQAMEYCNVARIPASQINKTIPEKEEIISISKDVKTNLYGFMLKYYLYPHHKVYFYNAIEQTTINYIKEKIEREQIQYLYVCSTDEELNEFIYQEFHTKIELKETTLYQIQVNENSIELKEIPLD